MKNCHILITIARRAIISSFSTPWGRQYICNFGAFIQIPDCMPKIWKICKSAYISEMAACRAKISLISTPLGIVREHICHFGTFLQILGLIIYILKMVARRVKISIISTLWERHYKCNFGTCHQISDFLSKYGNIHLTSDYNYLCFDFVTWNIS